MSTSSNGPDPKLDRSKVKWSNDELEATLKILWSARGTLRVPMNVRAFRMIGVLRRRLDMQGYRLSAVTELGKNDIVMFIRHKRVGARPVRTL